MKKVVIILVSFWSFLINGQTKLNGAVFQIVNQAQQPLPGASVYWLNTSIGVITDIDGKFSLDYNVSY